MNIELVKTDRIKTHLLLQFEGICGIGSAGNSDVDFIIKSSKVEILKEKNTQSIIFDFSNLRYEFGNRFVNIFNPNNYNNNKNIYIRIIPNKNDINNWKSLITEHIDLNADEVIQENSRDSIMSINRQMNS